MSHSAYSAIHEAYESMNSPREKTIRRFISSIADHCRESGLGIDPMPEVSLDFTENGEDDPTIDTGSYSGEDNVIIIRCGNRQLKDILRTFSHELAHHMQHLENPEGFESADKSGNLVDNGELERIEGDAYRRGNLLFRKWTETLKDHG